MARRKTMNEHIESIDAKIAQYKEKIELLRNQRGELAKECTYCRGCGKYYETKKAQSTDSVHTGVECIYQDCGYGDDDVLADVTRKNFYTICPECGFSTKYHSIVLNIANKRTRR